MQQSVTVTASRLQWNEQTRTIPLQAKYDEGFADILGSDMHSRTRQPSGTKVSVPLPVP
jgi:hypothetical protein